MLGQFAPCAPCADGRHEGCEEGLCGCHIVHPQDIPAVRGFKRLKYPEENSA